MKVTLLTLCSLWFALGSYAQSAIGSWETIDENSGEVRSIIEIFERDGKLFGKIAKTMDASADPTCGTCSGKFKDQPYLGMEIMSDLEPGGEKEWEDGEVYDPESDKTYGLSIWIEEDPNVLYVRGKHWTGLYRTQTWRRAES